MTPPLPHLSRDHCAAVCHDEIQLAAVCIMAIGVKMNPYNLALGMKANSARLENHAFPYIESFYGMPTWTEVCEAAYGRSQKALADITLACCGIVVSWGSVESTMMRCVPCSECVMA
jgi:hypothetical protein